MSKIKAINNVKAIIIGALFIAAILALRFSFFVTAAEISSNADLFIAEKGVTKITADADTAHELFLEDYNGVLVDTRSMNASVKYANTIDANALTKDKTLAQIAVLSGGDYAQAKELRVFLTDSLNPQNKIGIGFYPAIYEGEGGGIHSYSRVIFDGTTRGLHTDYLRIWENEYGTGMLQRSLYSSSFAKRTYSFNIYFDYAEKAFYSDCVSGKLLVLDLDNEEHVGARFWEGFTADTCELSIEIDYATAKVGGLYVISLLDNSLSGKIIDIGENAPNLYIKAPEGATLESLPYAQVGTEYILPKAIGFDFLYGICDVSVSVYRQNINIGSEVSGGILTPSVIGELQLTYSAENADGNVTVKTILLNVEDKLPPYIYSKSHDELPLYNEFFVLPKINVSGGSGELKIHESVEYNGKKLELSENRKVFINQTGLLKLTVKAQGYCGADGERVYLFAISLDKAAIILDGGVPVSVRKGENLILPDFYVLQDQAAPQVKTLTVNGVDVLDSLEYAVTESAGQQLCVTYGGGTGDGYTKREFIVRVIEPNYSLDGYMYITSGTATLQSTSKGVVYSGSSNSTMQFGYPVVMDDFYLEFDFKGNNTQSLDIIFDGYINKTESVFFRIYHKDSSSSYLQVDGTGKLYTIPVGFSQSGSYMFQLQNSTGTLYFGGDKVCSFAPFYNGAAVVSVRLNGVSAQTEVTLKKFSNQSLYSDGFIRGDITPPLCLFSKSLPTYIKVQEFGALYTAPSAVAYDALSNYAEVLLKITAPSSKVLYEGTAENARSFTLSEYGIYFITYLTKDTLNNSARYNYLVELSDNISPVLTVLKSPNASYKVGDTLKVSDVRVSDNYDQNCTVEVFLLNNLTAEMELYAQGSQINLKKVGYYTLIYKAYDKDYNVTRIEYLIKVEA